MQVNNASSSQITSSSASDVSPDQITSAVTGVTNSLELITTASSTFTAYSSQESQSITRALDYASPNAQAPSPESNPDEIEIDDLGNIPGMGINIHQINNFDFDLAALDALDTLDTSETETAATETLSTALPNPSPVTPTQEEEAIEIELDETTDEEDETPSCSSAAPAREASTSSEVASPSLIALLAAPTNQPLPIEPALSPRSRELAVAAASQARIARANERARKRGANAPPPRRCERLTLLEYKQIVDYAFTHCSGLTLKQALAFIKRNHKEAFKGILTSRGEAYTSISFRAFSSMVIKIKGNITTIP